MTRFSSFDAPFDAVVIGALGGIGAAFTKQLEADDGVGAVLPFARSTQDTHIDLTNESSIEAAAARASQFANLRLVIVAAGLLHDGELQPEKALRDLSVEGFERNFAVNTIGPALVLKHFARLMPRTGKSAIACLSARVGSISDNRLGGWYAYRASKAALNMVLRTSAIELARTRRELVVLGLHPGTVDTGLSAPFQGAVADGKLFSPEQSASHLLDAINAATIEQSGSVVAWDGSTVPA